MYTPVNPYKLAYTVSITDLHTNLVTSIKQIEMKTYDFKERHE